MSLAGLESMSPERQLTHDEVVELYYIPPPIDHRCSIWQRFREWMAVGARGTGPR